MKNCRGSGNPNSASAIYRRKFCSAVPVFFKKVALRLTLIKVIQDAEKSKGISLIANARAGHLEGWTFIPMSKPAALEKQRRGILVFTDED